MPQMTQEQTLNLTKITIYMLAVEEALLIQRISSFKVDFKDSEKQSL